MLVMHRGRVMADECDHTAYTYAFHFEHPNMLLCRIIERMRNPLDIDLDNFRSTYLVSLDLVLCCLFLDCFCDLG